MDRFLMQLSSGGVLKKDVSSKKIPTLISNLFKHKAIKETNSSYMLKKGFSVGRVCLSKRGVGYLDNFNKKHYRRDILIEGIDSLKAGHGDIILLKVLYRKKGRLIGRAISILQRAFSTKVVYIKNIDSFVVGMDIKTKQKLYVSASQSQLKKFAPYTVLKLDSSTLSILDVLGNLYDESIDDKISLALFNKGECFSKKAQEETLLLNKKISKDLLLRRDDMRSFYFCTIDPTDAKDFDDAIYYDVSKSILYVAIADVSSYVNDSSHIDSEAKNRGVSIYFAHKSIPMLPRLISEDICSLREDEPKLAFVVKLTLDVKNAKIKKVELKEAVIKSRRRFSYNDADSYINGRKSQNKIDLKILDFLLPLNEVIKGFRKNRLKEGYTFHSSEIKLKLDSLNSLKSSSIYDNTQAQMLIEDCMLLANKSVAKMLGQQGIYRVHEKPSQLSIKRLLEDVARVNIFITNYKDTRRVILEIQSKAKELGLEQEVDKMIIKAQQQAIYSSENLGHFGLGFSEYTHFTSPIRRYSDLILHRLLKAYLKQDKDIIKYILKDMKHIASSMSKLEREAAKVEWDFMDRKFSRWASRNIGNIFKAKVVDLRASPIVILEDDKIKGSRVFLRDSRADINLFDKVFVQISSSDVANTRVIGKIYKRCG